MKKQRFYPKQVMKQLKGKSVSGLDEGEKAALSFFMRRGRKYGMAIGVLHSDQSENFLGAGSYAESKSILANSTSRVF